MIKNPLFPALWLLLSIVSYSLKAQIKDYEVKSFQVIGFTSFAPAPSYVSGEAYRAMATRPQILVAVPAGYFDNASESQTMDVSGGLSFMVNIGKKDIDANARFIPQWRLGFGFQSIFMRNRSSGNIQMGDSTMRLNINSEYNSLMGVFDVARIIETNGNGKAGFYTGIGLQGGFSINPTYGESSWIDYPGSSSWGWVWWPSNDRIQKAASGRLFHAYVPFGFDLRLAGNLRMAFEGRSGWQFFSAGGTGINSPTLAVGLSLRYKV